MRGGDKRTGELFSYLAAVLDQPRVKKLLSTDHFAVDGTADRSVGFVEEL